MADLEKHVIAFGVAVAAVVAGIALFYFAELDQQIMQVKAAQSSTGK